MNASEIAEVEAYLNSAWPQRPPRACHGSSTLGDILSQKYALTRYINAIQSRGTIWPIKFNGQAFTSYMDDGAAAPDYRNWGPSNWWQKWVVQTFLCGVLACVHCDAFAVRDFHTARWRCLRTGTRGA